MIVPFFLGPSPAIHEVICPHRGTPRSTCTPTYLVPLRYPWPAAIGCKTPRLDTRGPSAGGFGACCWLFLAPRRSSWAIVRIEVAFNESGGGLGPKVCWLDGLPYGGPYRPRLGAPQIVVREMLSFALARLSLLVACCGLCVACYCSSCCFFLLPGMGVHPRTPIGFCTPNC